MAFTTTGNNNFNDLVGNLSSLKRRASLTGNPFGTKEATGFMDPYFASYRDTAGQNQALGIEQGKLGVAQDTLNAQNEQFGASLAEQKRQSELALSQQENQFGTSLAESRRQAEERQRQAEEEAAGAQKLGTLQTGVAGLGTALTGYSLLKSPTPTPPAATPPPSAPPATGVLGASTAPAVAGASGAYSAGAAPAAETLAAMNAPATATGAGAAGASGAGAAGAGASTSAATLPVIGAAIVGASLTKENAKPSMESGGPEGYLAKSAQHPFAAVADPFTTENDLLGTGQSPVAKSEEWVTSKLGTVICTELHRQGLLSDELYDYDKKYPVLPEVYAGYRILADPVVKLMQKYPGFARLIAPLAIRTATEMAHRVNRLLKCSPLGGLILLAGEPLCGFIGRRRLQQIIGGI